ncbi:hypothetical protein [Actinacidiphila sp. ITFR-21]|uniref:hypothetical protein n=1 Tax=Actinacidiphila sp. ITFR-21 TaxID=3075199 RepID=UPI00288C3A05|nr:hypothetical protein [Streptomyces sp. ITFR-21]WNI17565.1 hypothetical protein RLT57_19945 [Streptomyces sp. ITFR-21]WNI17705.1 hypothetical protein RLT57_20660 [Streptomyces sp. ITFR-21]
MLTAVLVVEGVLRIPGTEGHYDTGWGLYQALVKNSRLHLLSHTWTEQDIALWLTKRHLTGHQSYLHAPEPGPAGRLEVLQRVRAWRIGALVIESDPACATAETSAGWNTALVTPAFQGPQQPTPSPQEVRPWTDLAGAVERQHDLRLFPHSTEQP